MYFECMYLEYMPISAERNVILTFHGHMEVKYGRLAYDQNQPQDFGDCGENC